MQEEFSNHHPISSQVLFERVDVLVALFPDMLRDLFVGQLLRSQQGGVDAHDQYFFVVGAIENADLAAFRNALMRSPKVIVVQLFIARCLEGVNVTSLRIYARHNVLDHAILSGGV